MKKVKSGDPLAIPKTWCTTPLYDKENCLRETCGEGWNYAWMQIAGGGSTQATVSTAWRYLRVTTAASPVRETPRLRQTTRTTAGGASIAALGLVCIGRNFFTGSGLGWQPGRRLIPRPCRSSASLHDAPLRAGHPPCGSIRRPRDNGRSVTCNPGIRRANRQETSPPM